MPVVWDGGAGVAPPYLCRVQGVGAAETEAVGESGEGLWVEAPKGTGSAKAVERRSYRGGTGVPKGHRGWVLVVGRGDESPQGGAGGRGGMAGGR